MAKSHCFQVRPPGIEPAGRCFLTKAVILDTEAQAGEGGFLPASPPSEGSPALPKSPWISHLQSISLEIPASACRVIMGLVINARLSAVQGGCGRDTAFSGLQERLEVVATARIRRAWPATHTGSCGGGSFKVHASTSHRGGVGRERG